VLYDEVTGSKKEAKDKTTLMIIKEMIERLVMRDGFKIGGEANYVIENWENCRHAQEELVEEGRDLVKLIEPSDMQRLRDPKSECFYDWLMSKHYSPDRAEKYRVAAKSKMHIRKIVKEEG
jgi:hypothetical protein